MSDLVTRMDIVLHDRVQNIQEALQKLKRKAKSEAQEFEDEFFDKIHNIEEVLKDGRERVNSATETIDDIALETLDNIKNWRTSRKVKKLEKEAEKSRHYAKAAIDVAIGALDEAEWAITRAYMTREFAENVSKT